MSVQFGRWNLDGRPGDRDFIEHVAELTRAYGPDTENVYVRGPFAFLFQSFYTTKDCGYAQQPLISSRGTVLTWDGRLDNREELVHLLDLDEDSLRCDSEIVLAMYERHGAACLTKLIGDWALVVWDATERALFLAKDFIGARSLFYSTEENCVTWSTVLDPLVILAGRTLGVSEEFVAGYLSRFPATDVTPYAGIRSVPAGSFLRIEQSGRTRTQDYWRFDPTVRIHYSADTEYETHFRALFAQSIRRRLRTDFPVLAELSGGMDSTAIVCMADRGMATTQVDASVLHTISYYDDGEPN